MVRQTNLLARFLFNVKRTSPVLLLRIGFAFVIYSPGLVYSLLLSWRQMARWRKIETARDFLRRHQLAFEGVDPSTLNVISQSGGVMNVNQIWQCRGDSGETAKFFVKVFVPIGSFWARHLSLVSPFPKIYGERSHERFTVDMVSRAQLAERGVSVPRLVAYDTVERVMVTEYLEGETVDDILKRIEER